MTADRVKEIEGRLAKATLPVPGVGPPVGGWYRLEANKANADLILHATADIAYLLSRLQAAEEVIEAATAREVWEAIASRAVEYVRHHPGCPALGGNGDRDCNCGAVKLLEDMERAATDG